MNISESIAALAAVITRRNYSACTRKSYVSAVESFLWYAHGMPKGKTPVEYINGYIMRMQSGKQSAGYINLGLAAIRFFFFEVRNILITVKDVPYLKKPQALPHLFSKEQIIKILSVPKNKKHQLLLLIAYGCGLRVSEVVQIRLCDFELDRKMLKIRGKGEKDRYVPIGAIPTDLLLEQMQGKEVGDYLFNRQYSKEHLSKRTAEVILDHACKEVGIETKHNFHMLRHGFATHSLERGTGIYDVQKLLGHSKVTTTQLYLHVSNAHLAKNTGPLSDILTEVV